MCYKNYKILLNKYFIIFFKDEIKINGIDKELLIYLKFYNRFLTSFNVLFFKIIYIENNIDL